ncbi:MAG: hypothetical protein ACK6DA_00365 [Candidatus Kapaibacterium sp.]
MQKFTIAEILRTRRIGTLGKHSTLDDIIAIYGEPDFYRPNPMRYNENFLVYYGSLIFTITARKKRICEIYLLAMLPGLYLEKHGPERILSDAHILYDYSQKEIEDYFLQHDLELELSEEDRAYNNNLEVYYPKHCKRPFTKLYPSFYVQYNLNENNIYEISMRYDYR